MTRRRSAVVVVVVALLVARRVARANGFAIELAEGCPLSRLDLRWRLRLAFEARIHGWRGVAEALRTPRPDRGGGFSGANPVSVRVRPR